MENHIGRIVVLIPAYKPEEPLVTLSKALKDRGFKQIVIVDDGGGEK
jgi:hypothetical protein